MLVAAVISGVRVRGDTSSTFRLFVAPSFPHCMEARLVICLSSTGISAAAALAAARMSFIWRALSTVPLSLIGPLSSSPVDNSWISLLIVSQASMAVAEGRLGFGQVRLVSSVS